MSKNRERNELVTYLQFNELEGKDTLVISVNTGWVVTSDRNYIYIQNPKNDRPKAIEPYNVFKHVVVKFDNDGGGAEHIMCDNPKNIWRKAADEPERGREIVAFCIENEQRKLYFIKYDHQKDLFDQDSWDKVRKDWNLKKWCYVQDLFNATVKP